MFANEQMVNISQFKFNFYLFGVGLRLWYNGNNKKTIFIYIICVQIIYSHATVLVYIEIGEASAIVSYRAQY